MNCAEVQALLSEYIDDILDEETKMNIQKHLQVCSECRQQETELRMLLTELEHIEEAQIPEIFEKRLHNALCEEGRRIRTKKYKRIASLAAVFCVGLFSVILYNNNSDKFNNDLLMNLDNNSNQQIVIAENQAEYSGKAFDGELLDNDPLQTPTADSGNAEAKAKNENQPSTAADTNADTAANAGTNANANADTGTNTDTENGMADSEEPTAYTARCAEILTVSEQAEADEYLKQLESLITQTHEVLSYEYDEENQVWIFNLELNVTSADGNEVKEYVVYCGKDGALWKKEL